MLATSSSDLSSPFVRHAPLSVSRQNVNVIDQVAPLRRAMGELSEMQLYQRRTSTSKNLDDLTYHGDPLPRRCGLGTSICDDGAAKRRPFEPFTAFP